jgi:hypothetical protein
MAMPPRAPELLERLRRALEDDEGGGSPPPDAAGVEEEGVAWRGGGREVTPEDFARLAWRAYRS